MMMPGKKWKRGRNLRVREGEEAALLLRRIEIRGKGSREGCFVSGRDWRGAKGGKSLIQEEEMCVESRDKERMAL